MKILIADTYYPDFLASLPFNPAGTYDSELRAVLDQSFGTFDAYSRHLAALGHECVDVIYNHHALQWKWAEENYSGQGRRNEKILDLQIEKFQPDAILLQDLSLRLPDSYKGIVAAQCSCAFEPDTVKQCDVIFTSLPGHLAKFEALGVRAVYLPLCFDPIVLERVGEISEERIHDAVFIGGVGNHHWPEGMATLETIASEIPTFKWWGYGFDLLPLNSPLRKKYCGAAFGIDMYRILMQSKICVNRHGSIAGGYANNLRLFESTGAGALLLTEDAPNLKDFFIPGAEVLSYRSAAEAVSQIRQWLEHWDKGQVLARLGQKRTLRDHTYAQRMKTVSEVLTEMLCPA